MNIQVIGARGMLGSAVRRAVRRAGQTLLDIDIDITDPELRLHPRAQVVINCAGLVKGRAEPDSQYLLVNGCGPHRLAEACDSAGARLIQASTDCVFWGIGPHSEQSVPDATDIYARSKLAGEITRAPHLTVRTSFIGLGERGLMRDLLAAHQTGATVKASSQLLWSGHTVNTVADVLVQLAQRTDVTGLLHIPGPFTTRYDLVRTLAAWYELRLTIIDNAAEFRADRRLVSERWGELNMPALPAFTAQLDAMEYPT